MCLFTSARTVAIVFARSAGSDAMYCAVGLTFDDGFMDLSSSRTMCITERLKTSQRQGCKYRVSPSRAQARRLLSVLKVITRRGAVSAYSPSMAPAASRSLQARQSSWQRPRRPPLGCRTHPGLDASLPPPCAALRTPRGRPRSLSHARLRPHHLALPKEGILKRTLRVGF